MVLQKRILGHFSADNELLRSVLSRFMETYGVKIHDRSSRSSYNVGIVEMNRGIFGRC